MTRKFFTLEPEEEFLGVLRPSLWTLLPRIFAALVLVAFPFAFWSSLLSAGLIFGGCIAAASLFIGMRSLRDTRRSYLENGVYITSRRAIDVFAGRSAFRVTEILWSDVDHIRVARKGISSMIGYGHVHIRGTNDDGFSLVAGPLWKPDLVVTALPRVQ